MVKDFIEELYNNGLIYMYIGTLFSSDTLLNEDDCIYSLNAIKELKENIPSCKIQDKGKILDIINKAEKVVKNDLKKFQKNT
jgi:hypothetical protein